MSALNITFVGVVPEMRLAEELTAPACWATGVVIVSSPDVVKEIGLDIEFLARGHVVLTPRASS